MSNLIVKWRYIKSGTPKHAQRHVKYIATREGVEKTDESWKLRPATREQKRLINDLVKDFPNVKNTQEYTDFCKTENKYTATKFIGKAIDENVDLIAKRENYVEYIAKRPRVEKMGKHGLFSQTDTPIDLNKVAKEVAGHKDLVWTMVLSLKREDAERLGYDNANAWKELLRRQADNLAYNMRIPMSDLKWYGAFHSEGNHPHVHIVAYSTGKKPYMPKEFLKKLKAGYAKEIFKQDRYRAYVEQTKHRDELRQYGKERIAEIISKINIGEYSNPTVEALMQKLQDELKDYKGKRVYGYISASAKNLVNGIVDEMAKDYRISELYDLWYEQKESIISNYANKMPDRIPLSQNDEFKSIRNAVLKEVSNYQREKAKEKNRKVSMGVGALRLFRCLGKIICDSAQINVDGKIGTVDKKQLREINEKKQAQGLRLE